MKKSQQKKGKGGPGSGGKKTKRGGQKKVQCHNCGGDHFLRDSKEWKEIKEKTSFLLGKRLAWPPLPIWTGHRDGTPRPLESREGGGEGTSP